MSRPQFKATLLSGLLAGLLIVGGGCDTGPGSSLFDPDYSAPAPTPSITSVSPEESALAGVEIVIITGENFSPEPGRTRVYFDEAAGTILDISPSQITVRTPALVRQNLRLRVMVLGAEQFSNTVSYRLDPAAERFGNLLPGEEPFSITIDPAGNLYISMFADGAAAGVQRIAPDGSRSPYFTTSFSWADMAVGPDEALYAVRSAARAVFRLPEGGTQQTFHVHPAGTTPVAIEFAPDGALFTASAAGTVYGVYDGVESAYVLGNALRDIAIYQGYLFAAVTDDGASRIVRAPITGPGQLGATEDVAAVTASFGTEARRLAFAANGTLLVGTASTPALVAIAPDGSASEFYAGIVTAPVRSMAWGPDTRLFALARVTGIQESRGRQFPDLISIETRMEGF